MISCVIFVAHLVLLLTYYFMFTDITICNVISRALNFTGIVAVSNFNCSIFIN